MPTVASYISGIDLSGTKAQVSFPVLHKLTAVKWLKMNDAGLTAMPRDEQLPKRLEHVCVKNNTIGSLRNRLVNMENLKEMIFRNNCLHNKSLSDDLFKLKRLQILDLSHNNLEYLPDALSEATELTTLNVSFNKISKLPSSMFMSLNKLTVLDLSNNRIEAIPVQVQRLVNLKVFCLSENPLKHCHLRYLKSFKLLEQLSLSNTGRDDENTTWQRQKSAIQALVDLDVSYNSLNKIATWALELVTLRRLNCSGNGIRVLDCDIENLVNLEYLNLSRNELRFLPPSLMTLSKLKSFYANSNNLAFDGIPTGVFSLLSLEIFSVSNNNLETIPEGLFRCPYLRKLYLADNKLISLPDSVYNVNLEVLDVDGNLNFVMPEKPVDSQTTPSLSPAQIVTKFVSDSALVGDDMKNPNDRQTRKDQSVARRKRLKHLRSSHIDRKRSMLKNMGKCGLQSTAFYSDRYCRDMDTQVSSMKKPVATSPRVELDYSELFHSDIGIYPGIYRWQIDAFAPTPMDQDVSDAKFFDGDCYVILYTTCNAVDALDHKIYYWLGANSTVDKQACAAVHSVNLRNMLGSNCRTWRVEQGEETREFLDIFENAEFMPGTQTESGFQPVKEKEWLVRAYRLLPTKPIKVDIAVPNYAYITEDTVFLVDSETKLYLRNGSRCTPVMKSTCRLFAEMLNRSERKNSISIEQMESGNETPAFWKLVKGPPPKDFLVSTSITVKPTKPLLYKVKIGKSTIDLPQVDLRCISLSNDILGKEDAYIVDCDNALFLWFGSSATRFLRKVTFKIAEQLLMILDKPEHVYIAQVTQGQETSVFLSFFDKWTTPTLPLHEAAQNQQVVSIDDPHACVDNPSRNQDKTESAQLQKKPDCGDLSSLFTPRATACPDDQSSEWMDFYNLKLHEGKMDACVFNGKKFVKLSADQYGIFYTEDCYVYFAKYKAGIQTSAEEDQGKASNTYEGLDEGDEKTNDDDDGDDDDLTELDHVVYFWQGSKASNLAWFLFNFQLKRKYQESISENLQVVRFKQQQESMKFLAHFKRETIIQYGSMFNAESCHRMFQVRWVHSKIYTRTVEVPPESKYLCSEFCYIIVDGKDTKKMYLWIGQLTIEEDILTNIACKISPGRTLEVIYEGKESEVFWEILSGKFQYDKAAEFLRYARLFKCSNDKGYFAVSERFMDFCQQDLDNDDVMLLDTGNEIFIWMGWGASEIELKMAFRAAQAYFHYLKKTQPDRPRKIKFCAKGRETWEFTRCFHSWLPYERPMQVEKNPLIQARD